MLDSDYINLTEASKLAGLKDYSSLYRAARTGRLKTVVHLRNKKWVQHIVVKQPSSSG